MSYFDRIFENMNLQYLSNNILFGIEPFELDPHSFQDRENRAYKKLEKSLIGQYSADQFDEILTLINEYVGVIEQVYFAAGMKCGARILFQLLTSSDNDNM